MKVQRAIAPLGTIEVTPALLLGAAAAAAVCGALVRTWRSWDSAGRIPRPVRVGRSSLWRTEELRAWIAAGCPRREVWEAMHERQPFHFTPGRR